MIASHWDILLLPRTDAFQNEYLPPHEEIIQAITGFTGSAGFLVLRRDGTGALFVDGRYLIQATQEVDTQKITIVSLLQTSPTEWVRANINTVPNAAPRHSIGFDPWRITPKQYKAWQTLAVSINATLYPLPAGWEKSLWLHRPPPIPSRISEHPEHIAGQPRTEKIALVRQALSRHQAAACLISDPASVCWLLNIRGRDVPFTPLVCGYALVYTNDPVLLFVNGDGFCPDGVKLKPLQDLLPILSDISGTVLLDNQTASAALAEHLGEKALLKENPCLLPKACKNAFEINGVRAAHHRDGKALSEFLNWLRSEVRRRPVTEAEAASTLDSFRGKQDHFIMPSFPSIIGSGPNGAIIHYRPPDTGSRVITRGELLLIDSGGQYIDGTTDVTRTIWLWDETPPADIRRAYTLVLKGHIAIATARFPTETTGAQLDVLARRFLWQAGLDYDHGTGHGVGAFLSVHEGPQGISKRNTVPLQPGMILSNEPGYYKPGAFGIRIENLVLVRDDLPLPTGFERPMLGFETLTKAPFEEALIETSMLTSDEKAFLLTGQHS